MHQPIAAGAPVREPDQAILDQGIARAEFPFSRPPGDLMGLREQLGTDMWEHVGIVRTAQDITTGQEKIVAGQDQLNTLGLTNGHREFNLTWHDWLNLDSLYQVSGVIAAASLARQDSRGAHYREDYPDTGDLETSCYTRIKMTGQQLELDMVPVEFTIVRPGESLIDDEAGAPPRQTN